MACFNYKIIYLQNKRRKGKMATNIVSVKSQKQDTSLEAMEKRGYFQSNSLTRERVG